MFGVSEEELERRKERYLGKTIRIISMNNPNTKFNVDDSVNNGNIGVVNSVDGIGQLHGTWDGPAVIPEVDIFEIIPDNATDIDTDENFTV